jgi:hypothetical protein
LASQRKEPSGLRGAAQVGRPDDLHQRHARTVEVDQADGPALEVHVLARVLLDVGAHDPDALGHSVDVDLDPAVLVERQLELRDLVTLGKIRIEVVLAGEAARMADLAPQRQSDPDRVLERPLVEDGQRAGQPQAHRAHVRVGRAAK